MAEGSRGHENESFKKGARENPSPALTKVGAIL